MTEANIYSQGYRRYEGERTGSAAAIKAMQSHSFRKALGLRRGFRFKVVPILIILLAYVPVVAFVGFAVIFGLFLPNEAAEVAEDFLPTTAQFFGTLGFATTIMAGYVGPLILSDDRRDGMLGVALSSVLTRGSYLLAKGWTLLIMIFTVLVVPQIVLLLALTTQGIGPDGIIRWLERFGHILVGGVVIGSFYMLLSLAISAVSDRRSYSWIAYFVGILVSGAVADTLAFEGSNASYNLLNLRILPIELVHRILGSSDGDWSTIQNSTTSLWIAWFLIVAVCIGVTGFQYTRLLVRK